MDKIHLEPKIGYFGSELFFMSTHVLSTVYSSCLCYNETTDNLISLDVSGGSPYLAAKINEAKDYIDNNKNK